MRTVLIATYTHPVALGLRYVSASLKAAGHDVEMIFMTSRRDTAEADFSRPLLEDFIEHCRRADLIGMGLITNSFYRASFLTDALRRAGVKAPIIWGGTHATVAPEESLEVADAVCIGEGEKPLLELVERLKAGRDPTDVGGLAFRAGGRFGNPQEIRNPVRSLIENLDELPFPDYDLSTHWVADGGGLLPATPARLRGALDRLRVLSTRGCPYRCNFCNNTAWARIYAGKGPWVRRRSVDKVLAEIVYLRELFPGISSVNIVDDLFFVRDASEIADFADRYCRCVGLPLEVDVFPNLVDEDKIAALCRMPVALVSMGIQSGSTDTLHNIYRRNTPLDRIVSAIEILHRHRLPVEYHYIVNNPYEPDANMIETMRFVADHHPRGSVLRIFPLALYPGTPLYERARADGLIGARQEEAYRFTYTGRSHLVQYHYPALVLRLVLNVRNVGLPSWLTHRLIDLLMNRFVRRCLDHKPVMRVAVALSMFARWLYKRAVYQPFVRPVRSLWRRRRPRRRSRGTINRTITGDFATARRPLTEAQASSRRNVADMLRSPHDLPPVSRPLKPSEKAANAGVDS